MTIQTFIEKAIEGGWNDDRDLDSQIEKVFLNPLAWQAVVGDGIPEQDDETETRLKNGWPQHVYLMHRMIDALAEGKSISEFLETL